MPDADGSAHRARPAPRPPTPGPSWPAVAAMGRSVATRPDLWWTALGALRRLAAPGWWATRSHLPLPGGRLWAFRMVTAYGRPDQVPDRADVISYLEWCRSTAPTGRWWDGTATLASHADRRDRRDRLGSG